MEAGNNKPEEKMTNPLSTAKDLVCGLMIALVHTLGGTGAGEKAPPLFDKLVKACKQYEVHPEFTAENFPLEPVAPDEGDWEVHKYHFEQKMIISAAFEELVRLGYRLCNGPRRALEWVAKGHRNDQLECPMIITTSWQNSNNGHRYAPIFHRDIVLHRGLLLLDLDGSAKAGVDFLVLCKKQAV